MPLIGDCGWSGQELFHINANRDWSTIAAVLKVKEEVPN